MRFRLVEDFIDESAYKGEGNLVYSLVTLINILCGESLSPTSYVLHHLDFNHKDFDIQNLILLKKNTKKDVKNFRYLNANSAIHGHHKSPNENDYINFLSNLGAIDVFLSLKNGKLEVVGGDPYGNAR